MSRIVFTEGGIGGTGKTSFAVMLGEWYEARKISHALVDFDIDSEHSLSHFLPRAQRGEHFEERGIDWALMPLDAGQSVIAVDLPPASRRVGEEWFKSMFETVQDNGVRFTAVGMLTPDPTSISSVLAWASMLQGRAEYLIVKNSLAESPDFGYWDTDPECQKFREILTVREMVMEFRVPKLEHAARNHRQTILAVAEGRSGVTELETTSCRVRAKGYCDRAFFELDRVKECLV